MTNLAMSVTMKAFQDMLSMVTPNVSINVRGRHAIGKSEGVYQGAKKIFSEYYKSKEWKEIMDDESLSYELCNHKFEDGLPVVERRLSQLTEGDIVGLPHMTINKRTGAESTSFKPCDWLMQAVEFPVVLFLDERNRAIDGVKQAVFQLTDSKTFYGHRLHPETRIVIAENTGDAYQVQSCDPAEVSRCATVQLEPSEEEWLKYASTVCDQIVIDFVRDNPGVLEFTGVSEPSAKYPDRRTWIKLDAELRALNLFETPEKQIFRTLAGAFLGFEIGNQFTTHCRNLEKSVTVEEILNDWDTAKKKMKVRTSIITNEHYVALSEKVKCWVAGHHDDFSEKIIENLSKFCYDCPAEVRLFVYNEVLLTPNYNNVAKFNAATRHLIVATFDGEGVKHLFRPGNKSADKDKPTDDDTLSSSEEEVLSSSEEGEEATEKKKRGGRQ